MQEIVPLISRYANNQNKVNAVAYLAEESGRRIDLGRIWEEQRLSQALCDALKVACAAAHEHIATQEGNPGEASKRETCWDEFKRKDLPSGDAWRKELADAPFVSANTEEESLAQEWEQVRPLFTNDSRTMGELEACTGKVWVNKRRAEPACSYAEKTWQKLRDEPGMGLKKLRGLVELFSAAGRH